MLPPTRHCLLICGMQNMDQYRSDKSVKQIVSGLSFVRASHPDCLGLEQVNFFCHVNHPATCTHICFWANQPYTLVCQLILASKGMHICRYNVYQVMTNMRVLKKTGENYVLQLGLGQQLGMCGSQRLWVPILITTSSQCTECIPQKTKCIWMCPSNTTQVYSVLCRT